MFELEATWWGAMNEFGKLLQSGVDLGAGGRPRPCMGRGKLGWPTRPGFSAIAETTRSCCRWRRGSTEPQSFGQCVSADPFKVYRKD